MMRKDSKTKDDLRAVVYPVTPPRKWIEQNLTVMGEGELDDGTRVIMVKESLDIEPKFVKKMLVISNQ